MVRLETFLFLLTVTLVFGQDVSRINSCHFLSVDKYEKFASSIFP